MNFATVASGISAETVAWRQLGWKAQWYSEIAPFPSAVLAHHYPDTPNLGDMNHVTEKNIFHETAINLLSGGTPCQGQCGINSNTL